MYSLRTIISVAGPLGVMFGILKYCYYLVVSGFGQILVFCYPNLPYRKRSTILPADRWEGIRFKQTKTATFLRTGLLMQGW